MVMIAGVTGLFLSIFTVFFMEYIKGERERFKDKRIK